MNHRSNLCPNCHGTGFVYLTYNQDLDNKNHHNNHHNNHHHDTPNHYHSNARNFHIPNINNHHGKNHNNHHEYTFNDYNWGPGGSLDNNQGPYDVMYGGMYNGDYSGTFGDRQASPIANLPVKKYSWSYFRDRPSYANGGMACEVSEDCPSRNQTCIGSVCR